MASVRGLGAKLALLVVLPGCNQLLGISNPVAGDATEPDGPRPDGPVDPDAALDAPPACTTSHTFGAPITSAVGGTGVALAVARVDVGAVLDLVVSVTTDTTTLIGDGAGSFGSAANLGTASTGVVIDDFNQITDVRQDLMLFTSTSAVIRLQNAASPGTFQAEQALTGPFTNVNAAASGGLSGTGTPDFVLHDDAGNTTFEQLTGGNFSRENTVGDAGDQLIFVGSIDRDNDDDALFVDAAGNVKLSISNNSGVLQPPTIVATGATGRGVGLGRFDDDMFLDIMVATATGGEVYLQNSASPGVFTKQTGTFGGITSTVPLMVGDVNDDGLDDVVTPTAVVMQCPTTRVFTQVEELDATAPSLLVDISGNGKLDLLRLSGTDLVVRLQ
jgi:hypothetical protein